MKLPVEATGDNSAFSNVDYSSYTGKLAFCYENNEAVRRLHVIDPRRALLTISETFECIGTKDYKQFNTVGSNGAGQVFFTGHSPDVGDEIFSYQPRM